MGNRMTDIGGQIKVEKGTEALTQTPAVVNGVGIDRTINQYHSCVLSAQCGAATGSPTAQTVDAKLQESDLIGSGYTDISGAAVTQMIADDQLEEVDVDLEPTKQFIRTVLTVTLTGGSTPAIPVASQMIFGGATKQPV